MRSVKSKRIRGTAAQSPLDRGWGQLKQEIIGESSAGFIDALEGV
jgi:hypothetical protein